MDGRSGRKKENLTKIENSLKMCAIKYSSLYHDLYMGSYISGVGSVRFCVGKY
jgi:hypothetical protein